MGRSMSTTLYTYLRDRLQKLGGDDFHCPMSYTLNDYYEISTLLQAAGHNTKSMDQNLLILKDNIAILKKVTWEAKSSFIKEGIKDTPSTELEKECL